MPNAIVDTDTMQLQDIAACHQWPRGQCALAVSMPPPRAPTLDYVVQATLVPMLQLRLDPCGFAAATDPLQVNNSLEIVLLYHIHNNTIFQILVMHQM